MMRSGQSTPMVGHFARVPVPPPYIHTGARVHSFALQAPRDKLQALCDAWFAEPSGGRVQYKVLLPRIFVLLANIQEISPGNPKHADMGRTSEVDVGLWMLVLRTKPLSLAPRWLPVRLFVDSADAVVVGREVYGFPKELGLCKVPPSAPSAGPFEVQAYVTDKPHAAMAWRNVIDIRAVERRPDDGRSATAEEWSSAEDATVALQQMALAGADIQGLDAQSQTALKQGFSAGLMPFVFLRQFMAVDDIDNVCYLSIVEGHASMLKFRRGGVLPRDYEVTLASYHSHRFDQYLGLGAGPHRADLAIWSDFDFSMNDGSVLFTA